MKRLFLRPGARADLARAKSWYAEQRKGLDDELLVEVEATFRRVLGNPNLYPQVFGRVRRALTHRFPYKVFYLVHHEEIHILAIRHQSQEPRPDLEGS